MHRDKSAPETHTVIWDATLQSMRPCKNEYEELVATSEHHNRWMANSKASEICAFARIKSKGKLGFRGIELLPDRKITNADIPKLIDNGHRLPSSIKNSFVKAHGEHISKIFSPPDKDRPELFYPFFMLDKDGKMNEDDDFKKMFFKAITGIPAKARYEGYHMAVIGRFGPRWHKALMNIAKLILIMRYIPSDLKKMARFPIPKPGRKNKYRPISLCHDLYCFISGICNKYSSAGIEKANFLQDSITAYRPGRGCSSLVTVEQSFREDCREHDSPGIQIHEDEEKFFDRIPVAILLAAMRINGFPEQGYLEMKASAMGSKYVDIITKKGIAYAKFVCGLEQGNPDSPTVANLVIKLKHDVWEYISKKAEKIFKQNNNNLAGKYVFNSIDKKDGPVTLCKFGYCDDNSKYCFVKNENDLIFLTNYFLQLAGDLSMVTKIGRKGSKSEIQFFNVSAEFALKIKKQFSTAWSFVSDSPMEEEVPIKICLKQSELQRFMEISNYENMSPEDQEKWDKIIFPKAHRHLGLTGTLSGITRETCKKTLAKMTERIHKLKLHRMRHETQKKAFNMLCGTIHSFAPVQVGYSMKELEDVDRQFVKIIKRSRGLSSSDAKHRIFLPESMGGMGFNSVQDTDILSIARELEILSNSDSLESEAFRSRLAAIHSYSLEDMDEQVNHALFAIKKLARLGFHFRDQSEETINRIFSHLEKLPRYQAIGSGRYKNGNGPHIGKGKEKNLEIMFGGEIHKILKMLESVNWDQKRFREIYHKRSPVAIPKLLQMRILSGKEHFNELTSSLSCWQWINTGNHTQMPSQREDWSYIDVGAAIRRKYPTDFWKLSDHHILEEAKNILHIPCMNDKNSNMNANHEQYRSLWKNILNSPSPLFIATDGAHSSKNSTPTKKEEEDTSSSFVICIADTNNSKESDEGPNDENWIDMPAIPLLCRTANLPSSFGNHDTDIAHGELQAISMQEMAFSPDVPRVLITDSEAIRNIVMGLRNTEVAKINRKRIRTSMGGASKFLSSIIFNSLNSIHNLTSINPICITEIEELRKRTHKFLEVAKSWTTSKDDEDDATNRYGKWMEKYYDDFEYRPILKVNSHQLNAQGNEIKVPSRYPKLVPNVSILNMNHHADIGAEVGIKCLKRNIKKFKLTNPPSALRFQFTWEGSVLDKHVNQFIRKQIYNERVHRLKTKDTQGLLWRFINETTSDWSDIAKHKGWLRALTGLSRTHTRSLYKSEVYREGCNIERMNCISKDNICEAIKEKNLKVKDIITKCSSCTWCEDHKNQPTPKGNRLHAMLHCSHPHLSSFRRKMSNIIEQKLKNLFLQLQSYSNEQFIIDLLGNIEEECTFLQQSDLGRSDKAHHNDFTYISRKDLLKKYEISNCIEGLKIKGKFCSEIMGIDQQRTSIARQDGKLGILDAFWLGLVPARLDNVVKDYVNPYKLMQFTPEIAACKNINKELLESWNAIKDLLKAKAIGLHRIIGEISKRKEKAFKKVYEMSKGTFKEIKDERKQQKSILANSDDNIQTKPGSPNSPMEEGDLTQKELPEKVTCKGITCNRSNQRWSVGQNFTQQKVLPASKHCQRCSKFNTAMRQSTSILENIGIQPASKKSKTLDKAISKAITSGIDYTLMTTMLEECQMPTDLPSVQAITIKKPNTTKTLDRHKLICRIITQAMKTTSSTDANSTEYNTFSIAAAKIRKGLEKGETNLKDSKRATQQKQIQPALRVEQDTISIESSQESGQQDDIETVNISLTRRKIFREIEEDGKFISDDAITMSVEVLRHRFKNLNIFIAHGLANVVIEGWNQTLGWERFGRIFGTRFATFNKPNGTYLIPIFSGGDTAGHWHLVVVKKTGRFHQGWIIDSLGIGGSDSAVTSKIKDAFTTNRGQLNWLTPKSRRQVEYECGPRTIKGMLDICNGLKDQVSIEDCIKIALLTERTTDYQSGNIRREILNLARNHNSEMRAERITFRQQGNRLLAGRGKKRKRAPKRRAQRPSIAEKDLILTE